MLTDEQLQEQLGREFHQVTGHVETGVRSDPGQIFRAGRRIRRRRTATRALTPLALVVGLAAVAQGMGPGWQGGPWTTGHGTSSASGPVLGTGVDPAATGHDAWQLVRFPLGSGQASMKVPPGTKTFDPACSPSLLPRPHGAAPPGTSRDSREGCVSVSLYVGITFAVPPGRAVSFGGYQGTLIHLPNGHIEVYVPAASRTIVGANAQVSGNIGLAIGTSGLSEQQVLDALKTFAASFKPVMPKCVTSTRPGDRAVVVSPCRAGTS